MTSLELTPEQAAAGYRPLAGRVLLRVEQPPEQVCSIVIPQTAQRQTERDALLIGEVLAIGFGAFYDAGERIAGIAEGDVAIGDRVLFAALLQDINKRVILTTTTRIAAVMG